MRGLTPPLGYLNAKKSTQVISANAINSVLWPHRATVPTIFHSPKIDFPAHRGPRGPGMFMGAELYISRAKQDLLQVTKTVVFNNLAPAGALFWCPARDSGEDPWMC